MLQAKRSFWGRRPGFDTGDLLHIGVNVIFALMIYSMVIHWHLTLLAVVLILLSKWRILAVQPRFWIPNIKANLVDIIVGVSTVTLINQSKYSWIAIVWVVLYMVWLLFLKPREHDILVGVQAFWGQFLGILAIMMVTDLVRLPLLACLLVWLVAGASARHFFSNYEEPHYRTLSLVWAFLMAQLVWISLHWLQYYVVFGVNISVVAIIVGILSASIGSIYHAHKNSELQKGVVLENVLFAAALLTVVVVTGGWSARL